MLMNIDQYLVYKKKKKIQDTISTIFFPVSWILILMAWDYVLPGHPYEVINAINPTLGWIYDTITSIFN